MSTLLYPRTNEMEQADLNQKIKCMKRIKLQMKKKLFEAKQIGDIKEQEILIGIISRLEQKNKD